MAHPKLTPWSSVLAVVAHPDDEHFAGPERLYDLEAAEPNMPVTY